MIRLKVGNLLPLGLRLTGGTGSFGLRLRPGCPLWAPLRGNEAMQYYVSLSEPTMTSCNKDVEDMAHEPDLASSASNLLIDMNRRHSGISGWS